MLHRHAGRTGYHDVGAEVSDTDRGRDRDGDRETRDRDRGISVRRPLGACVCIHHRSIAAVLPQAVICKIRSLLHAETGFSPCFLWHLRQHSTLPGACGHDGLWETVALSLVIYY